MQDGVSVWCESDWRCFPGRDQSSFLFLSRSSCTHPYHSSFPLCSITNCSWISSSRCTSEQCSDNVHGNLFSKCLLNNWIWKFRKFTISMNLTPTLAENSKWQGKIPVIPHYPASNCHRPLHSEEVVRSYKSHYKGSIIRQLQNYLI